LLLYRRTVLSNCKLMQRRWSWVLLALGVMLLILVWRLRIVDLMFGPSLRSRGLRGGGVLWGGDHDHEMLLLRLLLRLLLLPRVWHLIW